MVLAGVEVDGDYLPGFLCYGVPVGCEGYAKVMLEEKVEKIAEAAERAVKVLADERHALCEQLLNVHSQPSSTISCNCVIPVM